MKTELQTHAYNSSFSFRLETLLKNMNCSLTSYIIIKIYEYLKIVN